MAKASLDCPTIKIRENDAIKVFSKINTRKAPGSEKIGSLLHKKCIHSLLLIIHLIYQLSAAIQDLPTIWKKR